MSLPIVSKQLSSRSLCETVFFPDGPIKSCHVQNESHTKLQIKCIAVYTYVSVCCLHDRRIEKNPEAFGCGKVKISSWKWAFVWLHFIRPLICWHRPTEKYYSDCTERRNTAKLYGMPTVRPFRLLDDGFHRYCSTKFNFEKHFSFSVVVW